LVIFGLAIFLFLFPSLKAFVLEFEVTPAQRGQALADKLGCFRCHGPDGKGGVPNPGSKDGEAPGFQGGMLMMYVQKDEEIREYILDGISRSKQKDRHYVERMRQAALQMPAYRDSLSAQDLEDLVIYLKASSALATPPDGDPAAKGMDLAYRNGCIACHNVMGAGGLKNPGSFKGYIPGWWGSDYDELVQSEAELREWIEEGRIKRLTEHPVARYFVAGQRVQMPAYKKFLKPDEIEAIMRFVQWVRKGEWRTRDIAE
jgi:mono/diheme cytochrome c family protein